MSPLPILCSTTMHIDHFLTQLVSCVLCVNMFFPFYWPVKYLNILKVYFQLHVLIVLEHSVWTSQELYVTTGYPALCSRCVSSVTSFWYTIVPSLFSMPFNINGHLLIWKDCMYDACVVAYLNVRGQTSLICLFDFNCHSYMNRLSSASFAITDWKWFINLFLFD